jgi:curli biogenesis system outer membrane secretion channel CsgG
MAEMLATALQKTGRFILVERNSVNEALQEQELAKRGKVQGATAAHEGQLIGAGYLVTGAVTEFGIRKDGIAARGLERVLPIGGGAGINRQTARVALDLRIFDTTTGQVIATEKAEATRSAHSLSADVSELPSVDVGVQGFDQTTIGKAARDAIEKAVALVEKSLESTAWFGRVVRVENNAVYINTGSDDSRKEGDSFDVFRAGEAMVDPDTGESLGAARTRLGRLKIVSIMGKRLSRAEAVDGADFQPGDMIQ